MANMISCEYSYKGTCRLKTKCFQAALESEDIGDPSTPLESFKHKLGDHLHPEKEDGIILWNIFQLHKFTTLWRI